MPCSAGAFYFGIAVMGDAASLIDARVGTILINGKWHSMVINHF
jgi:hypothetical protein